MSPASQNNWFRRGAGNQKRVEACIQAAPAIEHPRLLDIAWAAGLYEGEGTCCTSGRGSFTVQITQKDTEILEKMQRLFGGYVYLRKSGVSAWQACGARARGFGFTIFSFLSQRRRAQLEAALKHA